MRHIQTFGAIIFFVTLFLIFFSSNLHLETVYSNRATQEDIPGYPKIKTQVHNRDVTTQSPKQESVTVPQPDVQNVTVSEDFRRKIPQNQGYWNRLLYLALTNLDKGENPFRHHSNWFHCKKTNQQVLQTNMHDFSLYPKPLQNFVEGMDCRNSSVVINQPRKCIAGGREAGNQTLLLFGIKSSPGHFEQRQALRETWGREGMYQNGQRVRTVFLMGRPKEDDPDLSILVTFEAKHFGDILQWDFQESFLDLTLKMNVFLQWTLQYCPHVTFVFSGDDDVFVNTPLLLSYLHSLDSSKAFKLYAGEVINTASPVRDRKSKYFIPLSFYNGPYPEYAGGGGFLISGALLKPLYSVTHIIPFYPIDDVYTGMCFKALGVSPETHGGFHTFDVRAEDRENLCVHKDLILTHQRSPQEIKQLWRGIHSPLLTC